MLRNKPYIFIVLMSLSLSVSAETLRDPTLPGKGDTGAIAVNQTQHRPLVLNSIVSSNGSAYAVINNKIVALGGSIQGVKVVRIDTSSVSLSDGRKLTLFQTITER